MSQPIQLGVGSLTASAWRPSRCGWMDDRERVEALIRRNRALLAAAAAARGAARQAVAAAKFAVWVSELNAAERARRQEVASSGRKQDLRSHCRGTATRQDLLR
jgi:hypothetical protein